ncbi:MAG TPA: transposase [Aridibacter sp.]|nr:transposase [Aridibacter sp.]
MKMTRCRSHSLNNIHFVTTATFKRLPIFKNEFACEIFLDVLEELRSAHKLKVAGYVLMPEHVHMLLNPLDVKIGVIMRKLKGKSGRLIVDWIKEQGRGASLANLSIKHRTRRQDFAVWQKDYSSIDIYSAKFFGQKLTYIHRNPVEAGLCADASDWKYSSYNVYLSHEPGEVPFEIDPHPFWNHLEIEEYFGNYDPETTSV